MKSTESVNRETQSRIKMCLAMYDSFRSIGMAPWSDEHLGKVMAWAVVTGFREVTTVAPLFDVLMVAQHRFNIKGGAKPDMELMAKFYAPRVAELRKHKAETPWLPELMERYKVEGWKQYEYTWADDIKL